MEEGKEAAVSGVAVATPEYKPEDDKIIADIASEATVETEWPRLRDICKGRLVHVGIIPLRYCPSTA